MFLKLKFLHVNCIFHVFLNQSCVFSVRAQVDALIEAFGTTKQKRALNSRRLNKVGDEMLQQAVAQVASNIIDQKGVEGE